MIRNLGAWKLVCHTLQHQSKGMAIDNIGTLQLLGVSIQQLGTQPELQQVEHYQGYQ